MIKLKNILKCFTIANGERIQTIKDVSLVIHEREFISIIGPSGCGKSTLLRIVSELRKRDGGEVVLHDNVSKENLDFVFQDSVLFPRRSVYENTVMPLEIKHQKAPESLMHMKKLLELMKFEESRNSLPEELSGDIKQRTPITRPLSYDPKLLLVDEPFGTLDALTRGYLNLELRRLWKQTKKIILFVAHDIEEAVFLPTRVAVLSNRSSKTCDITTIDLPQERNLKLQEAIEFTGHISRSRDMLNEQV